MVSFLRFAALCLALASGTLAFADETNVLRTTSEIKAFIVTGEGRRTFSVTGLVLRCDRGDIFTLQDATGRAGLQRWFKTRDMPSPGDFIADKGFVLIGTNNEPSTISQSFTKLGTKPLPPPLDIALPDLDEDRHDRATIRTCGTVIEISDDEVDPSNGFLLLKKDETIMPVSFPRKAATNQLQLLNATVRVTGVFRRSVQGVRKFSGPYIGTDGTKNIEILTPAPADPFAAPALEKHFYLTPREISRLSQRTVSGQVAATWGENQMMVEEPSGRIVNVELADGESLPPCGVRGVAVGYPATDLFRINLLKARFRTDPVTASSDAATPEDIPIERILSGNWCLDNKPFHGKLIRIAGIVRSTPLEGNDESRILLDSGRHRVPVDVSSNPKMADGLLVGSEIEVTGRCLLETDNWRTDRPFPRIRGIVLVPRSAADFRVLARPPWLTTGKLLVVIGALLVVILCLYVRNRVQKRMNQLKVADRTQLAVELHDSMSQNLSGAALQITTVKKLIDTARDKALRHLDIAELTLTSCRKELRNCIWDLRSNALDTDDMNDAIRKTLEHHLGGASLNVRFNVPREQLSDNTAHALMRIIRELVVNAVQHGKANAIRIAGALEKDRLLFSVTDDGVGFDPANRPGIREGHFGLQGVEERIDELGGKMEIRSQPDKGARISIWIKSRC